MSRILAVSDCRCTKRHASTQDQQPLPPYPALLASRPRRCLCPGCERAPLLYESLARRPEARSACPRRYAPPATEDRRLKKSRHYALALHTHGIVKSKGNVYTRPVKGRVEMVMS
jgi:hypothetical protein